MKISSKLILASLTVTAVLGGSFAQATALQVRPGAGVTQVSLESDGWLPWFGGHHNRQDHRGDIASNDDDDACESGEDANDQEERDDGQCSSGGQIQSGTPPANGLFKNGQAPKAQLN